MSPYHGYPFGPVKVLRGLFTKVRPWHLIEALLEHATHAGRVVTRREAAGGFPARRTARHPVASGGFTRTAARRHCGSSAGSSAAH